MSPRKTKSPEDWQEIYKRKLALMTQDQPPPPSDWKKQERIRYNAALAANNKYFAENPPKGISKPVQRYPQIQNDDPTNYQRFVARQKRLAWVYWLGIFIMLFGSAAGLPSGNWWTLVFFPVGLFVAGVANKALHAG